MNRSCRGFLLSISALADDNLEAASVPSVRAHLAECPECNRLYEEQRELSDWLRAGFPDVEPAPEIWSRIESRLPVPRGSLWEQLGSGAGGGGSFSRGPVRGGQPGSAGDSLRRFHGTDPGGAADASSLRQGGEPVPVGIETGDLPFFPRPPSGEGGESL